MINLVASSAARSFLSLKKLMIHDCKIIEEVLNSEEGDDGEIAFMKLERFELRTLYMIEFPIVETLVDNSFFESLFYTL